MQAGETGCLLSDRSDMSHPLAERVHLADARKFAALLSIFIVLSSMACNRRLASPPIVRSAGPGGVPTSSSTSRPAADGARPAEHYTHVVLAQTALLRPGASDSDVAYDTVAAGTRVHELDTSGTFAHVVADDGREGLIALSRLRPIESHRVEVALLNASNPANPPLAIEPERGELPGTLAWPIAKPEQIARARDRAALYLRSQRNAAGVWDPPSPPGAPVQTARTALAVEALHTMNYWSDLNGARDLLHDNAPPDVFSAARRALVFRFNGDWSGQGLVGKNELIDAARGVDRAGAPGVAQFSSKNSVACYFGVRGLQALEQDGSRVPPSFWLKAWNALRQSQLSNGNWPAPPASRAVGDFRATAAGLLAMQITEQAFYVAPPRSRIANPPRAKAEAWLDRDLAKRLPSFWGFDHPCEAAWWTERVGDQLGRKYLGGKDWFAEVAHWLVQTQQPDGSWAEDLSETAYALMFLSRGDAPVAMSKLTYAAGANAAAWNERPGDVRGAVQEISRRICEAFLNWQIVNIDSPLEDLLDAPILYISGSRALNFNVVQMVTLRDYVEHGGLILGNADGGSAEFSRSFQELGEKLFPNDHFRELPPDHLIWNEMYRIGRHGKAPKVLGLSNGVRELMLLIPDADVARDWQEYRNKLKQQSYELAANLYVYAARERLAGMTKSEVRAQMTASVPLPRVGLTVGRIDVGANPDPEPYAWMRMTRVMAQEAQMPLTTRNVQLGDGQLSHLDFAHLTGTTAFTLTAAQRGEIKAFVDRGGVLLIDAAGGSQAFNHSADAELAAIFGPEAKQLDTPMDVNVLVCTLQGWQKIDRVRFRLRAREQLAGNLRHPRLRGLKANGRYCVIQSHEDLTAGMAGILSDGIIGYDVDSATAMVRNILLYAKANHR
jgi:hypothetical protein